MSIFEHTNEITFHTKHGKIVKFVKQPEFDEWCIDCSEYDHERHCCPRYNRVIREAVEEVKKERIYCPNCGVKMEGESE